MILGGDIGGIKVLLGLAENGVLIAKRRSASADFLRPAALHRLAIRSRV